ncbi:DUF1499 domain-containing protein [Roseibium polysiphoniae]|uniref:DUF1499 domain-containing protein n=1 Tax=Roseibium polysiphoniae TaxID=2571221 RepID=A0A944CD61_9HYPH|nr:DUF1499 domain-containing protein [Roseibium polysiphoniae]MBS8261221.1 DUF1499 domain-containing protein [Roseibium polysiphoniae]
MKRYPVFTSNIARRSRRVGAIALPVAVLGVLAHRAGVLEPAQMFFSILLATILGIAALFLAVAGFLQLWNRGGTGAGHAVLGSIYGIAALLPAAALAMGPFLQDSALDVSTDPDDPPAFLQGVEQLVTPNQLLRVLKVLSEVPHSADIVSRRYRMQPAELHFAALKAARRNGWRIVAETPPDLLDDPTGFQAEVKTPVLGLSEDVVVRIRPDRLGALFDMRSASRSALQDIGGNSDRIRNFYGAVDDVLLETYGEIESIEVLDDGVVREGNPPEGVSDVRADGDEKIPVPEFKPYVEGAEDSSAADPDSAEDLEG